MTVKYIDLDTVAEDQVGIKVNGQQHILMPVNVESFILNLKEIEKLGIAPNAEAEIELTLNMLGRAFPTMKPEEFQKLTLEQMQKMVALAHDNNGQNEGTKVAEAVAKADPTPAVPSEA